MEHNSITHCRVCNSKIHSFMSFGKMPIANGFLKKDDIKAEYFYELAPAFCTNCFLFQLVEQPSAEMMFHKNYAFYSSTSMYMKSHFKEFAKQVIKNNLSAKENPFVVELGSNDGIMLENIKNAGIRHLGIEPSKNVADVARSNNINTLSEFFDTKLADRIIDEYGHADVVLAANVMCHIANINNIARGISHLLKHDGVLIFEDPYLGDMIEKTSYDQIYDEHVFIFSAKSVDFIFSQYGLELIDVTPQITHGGSMRYVLGHKGKYPISNNVKNLIAKEENQGLDKIKIYFQFKKNCEASRNTLKELLQKLQNTNKRVVGYGATSKSTTITNYCAIGPDLVEYISDTTPIKHGKLSPGTHIQVKPYENFVKNPPDFALLFAWNHAAEIFEKEKKFKEDGGQWITYIPKVEIIH